MLAGGQPFDAETEHPVGSVRRSGLLARRLAGAFASVVGVATLICVVLLLLLVKVAAFVREMQRDEGAIRQGLELSMAVREQYIHAAHTMIVGDTSHLDHYEDWVGKVAAGAVALRPQVPPGDQWRVDQILQSSSEDDELFRSEIVPAVLSGDTARTRALHQRLDERNAIAAVHADFVARAVEARMSDAHIDTTHVTYAASAVAVLGTLLLIGLAMTSTRKLREAVLRPLAALAAAASRIGRGDFQVKIATTGDGELGMVATAFERMVHELSEHQRRLVASERMAAIGQLAAGVAHEINNPIGVIRGYLRTMIPEAERDDLRKELRILDEEAAACQRIADDLVAFARSPQATCVEMDTEVADLLLQTVERFRASGESSECQVEVVTDSCTLRVDPVRIRQVVQNLLRNAVQASSPGALVEVRGERGDDYFLIRVLDRGSGVAPELCARIFEPFVSGRANGTGLGLAVCDGIVRAHRGSIEARAREGGGTELIVKLPCQETQATGRYDA